MRLPRVQLFEFNDSNWAPAALRDTLVESLSLALERGRVLRDAVAPFLRFLDACGSTEVLDLCAGAGQPAAIFAREILAAGRTPPRFVLTDLFPHPAAWRALQATLPSYLSFVEQSVDATNIPPALGGGRARLIVNALHHFPPRQARALLLEMAREAPGIFVAEGIHQNPLRFAALAPSALPALYASPLRAKGDFAGRAALTWLSPLALAASVWDGCVSSLRAYTREELLELVAPLGDAWRWDWGELDFNGFGKGCWFSGVRSGR